MGSSRRYGWRAPSIKHVCLFSGILHASYALKLLHSILQLGLLRLRETLLTTAFDIPDCIQNLGFQRAGLYMLLLNVHSLLQVMMN